MKKTAFLINTARGPIINEAELVQALKEGVIAGAGVSVYPTTPFTQPDFLKGSRCNS